MRKIAAMMLMTALVSCSSNASDESNGSDGAPGCSTFAGQTVTADTFSELCTIDAGTADMLNLPMGERFLAGTGSTLCEDGSVLIWNNLGWAYEGQTFTQFQEGDEYVPPEAESASCAAS